MGTRLIAYPNTSLQSREMRRPKKLWDKHLKDFHRHMHFIVPSGSVSRDGSKWKQVKPDHLFHRLPAKRLYKKLLAKHSKKTGLYSQLKAERSLVRVARRTPGQAKQSRKGNSKTIRKRRTDFLN